MSIGERFLNAGLAVFLLIFGSLPMGIAGAAILMGHSVPAGLVPILVGFQLFLIALFLWLGKWRRLISFNRVWWSRSAWLTAGSAFILMYVVNLLGSYLIELGGQTTTANQQLIEDLSRQLPVFFIFLAVVIGAPLGEELLCRGFIPAVFSGRFELLGHVLGTLLFALLHGPTDVGSWLIYGGMGLILALIRYKSGRLEYAILAHSLNNFLGFLSLMGWF